jgi:hypothetical protein
VQYVPTPASLDATAAHACEKCKQIAGQNRAIMQD